MKKFIKFIGMLSAKLEAITKIVSIAAIMGMLIVIILQIIARYIFASPPTWTEEIGKLLMIWGGLLGTSIALTLIFLEYKASLLYGRLQQSLVSLP